MDFDEELLKKIYGCDDRMLGNFKAISAIKPRVEVIEERKEASPMEEMISRLDDISRRLEALEEKLNG